MLRGLNGTPGNWRAPEKSVEGRFVGLFLGGVCAPLPWIVEWLGSARPADAAHGCPALLDGEEATIRGTARIAAIDGAPGVGIVGQVVGTRWRAHKNGRNGQHGKGQSH